MSTLNTSLSGMLANTNWLTAISQNVSNANTNGYKNVEADFSALVNSSVDIGSEYSGVTSSIRSLNSLQGQLQHTSVNTDLAVQGSGFFIVKDQGGNILLTRNGSFVPDASGNLVNSSGYYLLGTPYSSAGISANPISLLTKVNVNSSGDTATPSTSGAIVANLNSESTPITGDTPKSNAADSQYTSEKSMIAYDDLGAPHTLNVYFTNTGTNTWEATVYDASGAASGGGFPYSNNSQLYTGTLNFSSSTGKLSSITNASQTSSTSPNSMVLTVPSGKQLIIDLSQTTQLASPFSVTSATINGNSPGAVNSLNIDQNGVLSYNYSNGSTTNVYTIPLANVASPDNMQTVLGDAFRPTETSGDPNVGLANQGGFGTINSSSLEGSTVDLATELTEMVQAQSSYQANSKVFQTGAKLLDILNNLQA